MSKTLRSIGKWAEISLLTPLWLTPGLAATWLSQEWGQALTQHWARTLLRRLGITVETCDPGGFLHTGERCIFVHLNQSSLLEALLWAAIVPRRMGRVLNIEFALLPFIGWTLAAQDGFVIRRQSPGQAKARLQQAVDYVRSGGNLILSIEGRRSEDGSLSPYKKGPVVMAIEAGATLVPLTTHGLRECLPFGAWRIAPGHAKVVVHEPIETRGLGYEDRDELVARLRTIAEEALADGRRE
ncbi:MAG: 1-acyl-sn-glycerol-3-phosphate acyltransferase [Myxococcales bacterium]|nr:1-acyl-sn-glycerol-3-phosphate acyltransferase [Myxococcales bacterium]